MHMLKKLQHIRLYWKCQFLGWTIAALYWSFIGFIGTHFSWQLALIHFVADLFIYISLTHLYRGFSVRQQWHTLGIGALFIRLIPTVVILGMLFMFITIGKNYLVRYTFQPAFTERFVHQLEMQWLTTLATGWRLMSIWLLAYYGYHLAQREINAVKEAARMREIAKDAAFQHLSAQLNPHFFFNALNSIKSLVAEDPVKARRAIDLLSDLLRSSLYKNDTTLIPVEEEMQLVKDYLELEKIRFEDRLDAEIHIDPAVIGKMILPLSVQLLVENAIKHGIAKSRSGGKVSIQLRQDNGNLSVTVESPGQWNDQVNNGLGLKNLKERLHLQFGDSASFQVKQMEAGTVTATLKTPVL
jgi:sensor histidine kinase YesM